MSTSKRTRSRKLNRFTTLPVLLDLLRRKKIVLLDPSTWEDKNDAETILAYKKRKRIPRLFAVCFGIGDETVHHWKTYANGISGCCIEFDEDRLLHCFRGMTEIRWGDVEYKKLTEVEDNPVPIDQRPFVKRWPYRCENEFRILWEGDTDLPTIDVDIDFGSINKITISQGMPADVYGSIKELLHEEIGDPSSKVNKSTLYENKRWIKALMR
jgi:hypothetical protein